MSEIYRAAFGVLVLDKDLQTIPKDTPTTELLMRIGTSNWRQRLWTYQEGFLAEELFIRGRCCTFRLRHVASYHKAMLDSSQVLQHSIDSKVFYRMLRAVLNDGLRDRKVDGPLTQQPGLGAQSLLTVISDRSTSRAGDEAICIATALSIDPLPLLPLPTEERMIRLLQLMPSIPINIIFGNCPRFDVPGFSWAPKSLLESGGSEGGNRWMIYHDSVSGRTIEEAHLTAQGLRLSLLGLDVESSVINPRNALPLASLSNPNPTKSWLISWNENIFRADVKSIFHDMTLDDIAPPKFIKYTFILGLWDENASPLPAVLVAWNGDEFDEGARIVQPLALGEIINLQRARSVLMDHLRAGGEEEPEYFPARMWCSK